MKKLLEVCHCHSGDIISVLEIVEKTWEAVERHLKVKTKDPETYYLYDELIDEVKGGNRLCDELNAAVKTLIDLLDESTSKWKHLANWYFKGENYKEYLRLVVGLPMGDTKITRVFEACVELKLSGCAFVVSQFVGAKGEKLYRLANNIEWEEAS